MIMYYLLACIFIIHYFDCKNFIKYDLNLCRKSFYLPRVIPLVLAVVIAFVAVVSNEPSKVIPLFIIIFAMPFYLIRRARFINGLSDEDEIAKESDDQESPIEVKKKFLITVGAYGVVLYWGYGVFLISIVTSLILKFLGLGDSAVLEAVITTSLSSVFILVLIRNALGVFSDKGFSYNIGLAKGERPLWKPILFSVFIGGVFSVISSYIIVGRQVHPQTPLSKVFENTQSPMIIFIFFVLAVLIAPFIEEIIFRGYFFKVIKRIRGRRFAFYSIALVFAGMHYPQYWGDWLALVIVTLLSFSLTLLRSWSGSLVPSVVMHYIHNTGVVIVPVIMLLLSNPAYYKYQAYYSQYDMETKERLLIESIKNQPELADAYNDLAWLYSQENVKLDEALTLIEKGLAFDPENTAYLDTKAEILFKKGLYEESEGIRRALLDEDLPDWMRSHLNERLEEYEN